MNEIDLTESQEFNIMIEKNRTLNKEIVCQIESGSTIGYFDFSTFSGATMEVRLNANDSNLVLRFSTTDGSIILGNNGLLTLRKEFNLLNIRSGEYVYDMYLSSSVIRKRGFLFGKFIIQETVTR